MKHRRSYTYLTADGDETSITLFLDEQSGKWTMSGMTKRDGKGKWVKNTPPTYTFADGEDAFYALNIYRGIAESQGWKLLSKEEDE